MSFGDKPNWVRKNSTWVDTNTGNVGMTDSKLAEYLSRRAEQLDRELSSTSKMLGKSMDLLEQERQRVRELEAQVTGLQEYIEEIDRLQDEKDKKKAETASISLPPSMQMTLDVNLSPDEAEKLIDEFEKTERRIWHVIESFHKIITSEPCKTGINETVLDILSSEYYAADDRINTLCGEREEAVADIRERIKKARRMNP